MGLHTLPPDSQPGKPDSLFGQVTQDKTLRTVLGTNGTMSGKDGGTQKAQGQWVHKKPDGYHTHDKITLFGHVVAITIFYLS